MTHPPGTTTATPGAVVARGVLHFHGRATWHDLATALLGADGAAWADYDGFHIGAPPASAPPYTHLWAWGAGWLLRARLDGETAIVGVLRTDTTTAGPPHPDLPPVAAEPISYTVRHAHTWPAMEKRVGPLDPAVTDRPADLYQVGGTHPVTFVRAR